MATLDNLVTFSDAAKELGVTVQRVHQLVAQLKLDVVKVNPKFFLLERKDVKRLKNRNK